MKMLASPMCSFGIGVICAGCMVINPLYPDNRIASLFPALVVALGVCLVVGGHKHDAD